MIEINRVRKTLSLKKKFQIIYGNTQPPEAGGNLFPSPSPLLNNMHCIYQLASKE